MNDGTQISKDVADIVLLNNAMSTLPRAFREGKETTQTIFGTMKMFLVRNFYNIAFFVFIGFMALPFPITPVQISWATSARSICRRPSSHSVGCARSSWGASAAMSWIISSPWGSLAR